MINLPETKADMLPGDFEGITEALKGTGTKHDMCQWVLFKIHPLY